MWFATIFSHSAGFLSILWINVLLSFLLLCSPTCCCFAFVSCVLGVISIKSLPRPMSRSFSPVFSSRSFMVSGFTFKSSIHFKFIFMSGIRWGPDSFFCMWTSSFPRTIKKINMLIDLRERGRERKRERNINVREKHWLVASLRHPNPGLNLQPKYAPWLGTEPLTFCVWDNALTNWFNQLSTIFWRDCLSSIEYSWLHHQTLVSHVCMGSLISAIGLCVHFCASNILFDH